MSEVKRVLSRGLICKYVVAIAAFGAVIELAPRAAAQSRPTQSQPTQSQPAQSQPAQSQPAQSQPLRTAGPHIELLTMGAGPTLFAAFGHAALRVRTERDDLVYNFGYTNFDSPWLVFDFLRGKALFWAAATEYLPTLETYRDEDRSFYRQPLRLTPPQARKLAALLEHATWPPKPYVYRHFTDNCATRLRDLIDQVVGGAVRKQLVGKPDQTSYRALVREGFSRQLGVLVGGEYLFGRALDHPIDRWEAGFLPRFLRRYLQDVRVEGKPLVGKPIVVYRRRAGPPNPGDPNTGVHILWIVTMVSVLLLLQLLLALRWHQRRAALFALPVLLLVGLLGLLPWALAFYAKIPQLSRNELTLLYWPTDLVLLTLVFRFARGRFYVGRWLRGYLGLRIAVVLMALAARLPGLFVQPIVWTALAGAVFGLLLHGIRGLPTRPPTPSASPATASAATTASAASAEVESTEETPMDVDATDPKDRA